MTSTGIENEIGRWSPSLDAAGNGTTTLTDLSGNGNDGTLTSMDAATDWVADTDHDGVRALDFDGNDDTVVTTLQNAGHTQLTLACWAKTSQSGTVYLISGDTTSSGSRGYGLRMSNGNLQFYGSSSGSSGTAHYAKTTSTFNDGDWHHLCVTFDSGTILFYIDGVERAKSVTNLGSPTNQIHGNDAFIMLGSQANAQLYYDGLLDDAILFDGVLTPTEIELLASMRGYAPAEPDDGSLYVPAYIGVDDDDLQEYDGGDASYSGTEGFEIDGGSGAVTNPDQPPLETFEFPGTVGTDGTLFDDDEFEFLPGTLARFASVPLLDDLAANPGREKAAFTTHDHVNGVYVRNPNRLLPSADLSAMSPYNSFNQHNKAGTAITARHIVFASHYQIAVDAEVDFVDRFNQRIVRTLASKQTIYEDLHIGTLDSDLPSTILPCQVMPADWGNYLGPTYDDYMAVFCYDQEENLITKRLTDLGTSVAAMSFFNATYPPYVPFTEDVIGGDSGNPIFLIINGRPIVLAVFWGSVSGVALHNHLPAIESYVGLTGHSLDYHDCSEYINYGS